MSSAAADGVELLHRAARQAEGQREERVAARPRDRVVERGRQHALLDVALEVLALEVAAQHVAGAQLADAEVVDAL